MLELNALSTEEFEFDTLSLWTMLSSFLWVVAKTSLLANFHSSMLDTFLPVNFLVFCAYSSLFKLDTLFRECSLNFNTDFLMFCTEFSNLERNLDTNFSVFRTSLLDYLFLENTKFLSLLANCINHFSKLDTSLSMFRTILVFDLSKLDTRSML